MPLIPAHILTMAPFMMSFAARDLASQVGSECTRKKIRGTAVQLDQGERLELLQYECTADGKTVVCRPVERFYRRFQTGKKSWMIETTAWENPTDGGTKT
ncbi:BgTH12-03646 [Blumeria graminis f. sp. triticale]|nr:BgTH12-03646 [Blumeria graminis f. sp. triticale]VCU39702.1 Bgt-20799 [Blumeria graminis f. sp. tritici]